MVNAPPFSRRIVICLVYFTVVNAIAERTIAQWATPAGRMWHTEIDRATLERFQHEIVFDEPRRRQAERLYKAHVDRFAEFVEEAKARLRMLEEDQEQRVFNSHEYKLARMKRNVAVADIAIEQVELDRQLLHQWKALLLEAELKEAWPRFERRWRREAWLRARSRYNVERVDLVQVVESLDLDWNQYINSDGENTLALTLDEYAARMDRLLVQLNDLLLEHESRRARDELKNTLINHEWTVRFEKAIEAGTLDDWRNDPERTKLSERSRQIVELGRRRFQEIHLLRDRICELNRFFTRWFLGMMPANQTESFERAWLEQSNPHLFVGLLARADSFAKQIRALDDLTDKQVESIERIMSEHEARALNLVRLIVRHQDRRRALSSPTRDRRNGMTSDEYHHRHVIPAFTSRYELGNETIKRLSATLTPEQHVRVNPPDPVDYQASLAADRRRQEEADRLRREAEVDQ